MKKKLLILVSALSLAICSLFAATPPTVPASVEKELQQQFKGVTDVKWKTTDRFYKATFSVNGQNLEAFFGTDGNFIGVPRNITVAQLPLVLSKRCYRKNER